MSLPYIPLYVDDYEAATAHLTIEEDGAYNRLLRLCWRTPGCSVPDDPKWIMRKMRVSADDYYRVVEPLIDEFFTRGMGRIFSARLQYEMQRASEMHEKRSEAAKKRWQKTKPLKTNKSASSNAYAPHMHPEPEPEPEPHRGKPPNPLEVLQEVLKPETAKDFLAHRKAMRKPVTEVAAKRIVSKLKGHPDPDAVVDQSIANGWQGVFPENWRKHDKSSNAGNAADMAERVGREWAARFMDSGQGDGTP